MVRRERPLVESNQRDEDLRAHRPSFLKVKSIARRMSSNDASTAGARAKTTTSAPVSTSLRRARSASRIRLFIKLRLTARLWTLSPAITANRLIGSRFGRALTPRSEVPADAPNFQTASMSRSRVRRCSRGNIFRLPLDVALWRVDAQGCGGRRSCASAREIHAPARAVLFSADKFVLA